MAPAGNIDASPAAEHRTVARVMSILELVLASDARGIKLGDLSAAVEAPKSTVHGLSKGLVAAGYLREEDGRYLLGPAVASLLAVGPATVQSIYRHTLTELTNQWNETSMLATLVGDSIVYLDSVESDAFIRATPSLNKRLPLWPRSSGKCILAFMDQRRLDAYLRRHHSDPEDAQSVRSELATVREQRVGFNIGDTIAEHIGIAAPIVPRNSPVTTAIAIAGPKLRMQDRIDEIAKSVREAAESLPGFAP